MENEKINENQENNGNEEQQENPNENQENKPTLETPTTAFEQNKQLLQYTAKKQKELQQMWINTIFKLLEKVYDNNVTLDKQSAIREIIDKVSSFILRAGLIVAFIIISLEFISIFNIDYNDASELKDIVEPMKDIIVYIILAFAGISFSLKPFLKKASKVSKIIEAIGGDD